MIDSSDINYVIKIGKIGTPEKCFAQKKTPVSELYQYIIQPKENGGLT